MDFAALVRLSLAELEALKMRESTIVAFTSDHGYHLGEHGEWEKKANFDLIVRVPLLIKVPGKPASAGRTTASPSDSSHAGPSAAGSGRTVALLPSQCLPFCVVNADNHDL